LSALEETHEEYTARLVAQTATATAKAVSEAAQAAAIVLARETNATITAIAVLQTKVSALECQQNALERAINERMDKMEKAVDERVGKLDPKFEKLFSMFDRISTGRPTWAVTVLIAALFSLSVGLTVAFLVHL
jgi:tetrahydromethanopterin S-methyltransferase subunit B